MTVSDTTAESFEGASTTAGILTTEYGAMKSNTVSINGGISLIYTVATPLFYTTDQLSDMEVEASVLQSSLYPPTWTLLCQHSILLRNR